MGEHGTLHQVGFFGAAIFATDAVSLTAFDTRRESGGTSETKIPWYAKPAKPRSGPKCGRNEPCPCGSGKKFKRCCLRNGERLQTAIKQEPE